MHLVLCVYLISAPEIALPSTSFTSSQLHSHDSATIQSSNSGVGGDSVAGGAVKYRTSMDFFDFF